MNTNQMPNLTPAELDYGGWQCQYCGIASGKSWSGKPNPDDAPVCCRGDKMLPYRIQNLKPKLTNMNMKQACEIVYAGMSIGQDTCRHEWYHGKCIHCNLTADWGNAVRELNAKLGVEHNRTVNAERNNKRLLAEVERLTMELNAVTNGEYTKQDFELERLRNEPGKGNHKTKKTRRDE